MNGSARFGLALLAALASGASDSAGSSTSRAQSIIAASKLASGGAAWDTAEGCAEEGTQGGGIHYKTWFSLKRYGMRMESHKGGSVQTAGFNGKASWRTGTGRGVDVRRGGDALKEAVVTAYLSNNGFFFSDRFPGVVTWLREAKLAQRTFDVVEMVPRGGRAFDVWFDRKTHLIGRVADVKGPQPVTVDAGDYRKTGGLTIGYALTVMSPDGKVLDRGQVTSFHCGAIDETMFDPPTVR